MRSRVKTRDATLLGSDSVKDFLKLWLAQSLARAGSEVSRVAVPLTAVSLAATPAQMGLLRAASSAPDFFLGVVVGAWFDRTPKRPLLIATALARALLLATIPAAAALHVLRLEHLFAVALIAGSLTLAGEVAQRAYLPQLVHPDDLVGANSRLTASGAGARLAGPAAGGALSALLTPAVALGVDSATLLAAAAGLWTIRSDERRALAGPGGRRSLRGLARSMTEGLRFMVADPRLRALSGSAGLFNFFDGVIFAVYVLYATRTLGITQLSLGLIFAAGGAGALGGAMLAGRITRKLGLGPALVTAVLVAIAGEVVIPFAQGPPAVAAVTLAAAELIVGAGAAVFGINNVSLRQTAAPSGLQGRLHAASRVVDSGLYPAGALLGGLMGQLWGMRAELFAGALGTTLAAVVILASPVRRYRSSADQHLP